MSTTIRSSGNPAPTKRTHAAPRHPLSNCPSCRKLHKTSLGFTRRRAPVPTLLTKQPHSTPHPHSRDVVASPTLPDRSPLQNQTNPPTPQMSPDVPSRPLP